MMTEWVMVIVMVSSAPSSMIIHNDTLFNSEAECVHALRPAVNKVNNIYATQGIAIRGTCIPVGTPAPI